MKNRSITVSKLASEAELDLDEALVRLWDADISYVDEPSSLIRTGDVNTARRALALPSRRDLASFEYWSHLRKTTPEEIEKLLAAAGFPHKSGPRRRLSSKEIRYLLRQANGSGEAITIPVHLDPIAREQSTDPPFVLEVVGHDREVLFLSADEVRRIHSALVSDFADDQDPIEPAGVRSESLLESAVYRPRTAIGGLRKYPTVEMAGAALFHALVHDHPFHNGNKRTALVSLLVFLDENGLLLTCSEDELFKLVLLLAQHRITEGPRIELPDREVYAIAIWLKRHSRLVETGDRPVAWRKLRRILAGRDCICELSQSDGSRMNIRRKIRRHIRIFGIDLYRSRVLSTQVFYGDDGRDAAQNTVAKIRRDLELDEVNGIDSASFYDDREAAAGEFIVKYRKTLQRLARL